jgi:hypothetical protein
MPRALSSSLLQRCVQPDICWCWQKLEREVKQARDALTLYHLEESDDSDDEKELDDYLQSKITNYIDNKSVRDLVNQGLLEPQPIFQ